MEHWIGIDVIQQAVDFLLCRCHARVKAKYCFQEIGFRIFVIGRIFHISRQIIFLSLRGLLVSRPRLFFPVS